MEKEELRLELSVDTKNALRELTGFNEAILNLVRTGKTNIAGLQSAISTVVDKRDITENRARLASLNTALKELRSQERGLKEVGISNEFEEKTRRARIAVYGLNQVVRDLPFGFIAISNNIPVLLDQFQALVQQTGSLKAGLRSFVGGLVGAGGLSIALSASISLITTAVQKYGSLSNAFNTLFGTLDTGALIISKFKKEIPGLFGEYSKNLSTISALNSVIATAGVNTKTLATANKLLVETVDDIIVSQDLQEQGVKRVSKETVDYAIKVAQARIVVEAYRKVIGSLAEEYAEASLSGRSFLDGLKGFVAKFNAVSIALKTNNFKEAIDILKTPVIGDDGFAQAAFKKRLAQREKALKDAFEESNKRIRDFALKEGLDLRDIFNITEPKTDEEKKTSTGKTDAEQALEERIKAQKELLDRLERGGVEYINTYEKIADLEYQLDKLRIKRTIESGKNRVSALEDANQKYLLKLTDFTNGLATIDRELTSPEGRQIDLSQRIIDPKPTLDRIAAELKDFSEGELAELNKKVAERLSLLAGSFANTFVSGLLEGRKAVDVLTDSIKRLVAQLAAAVARAAALKAINIALNAASGGATGLLGKGLNFLAGALTGGGRGFGGGFSAAPSFVTPSAPGQAQLVAKVKGQDIDLILNRTLRAGGRLG